MERARLIVKNFGPLKDIDIEVRDMVTFIGAQASGKSTLAKLLSIFEDENFKKNTTSSLEEELKKYNIINYLKEDSYIEYSTKNINSRKTVFFIEYKNKSLSKLTATQILELFKSEQVKNFDQDLIRQKLKQIVASTSDLCLHYDSNGDFLKLFKTPEQIKLFKEFYILFDKIDYDNIDNILTIRGENNEIKDYISIYEELIKLFPNLFINDSLYIPTERSFLHLIAENALGLINNNIQIPKHLLESGQDYEKALQTIKELPLSIIDKKIKYKREGKTSYIYHTPSEKIDLLESASGLQSVIPVLLMVEYAKSQKDKYNFNFVVEEPELNLYPKAQHELIKYLVANCLGGRRNLILTTHSPYILASINNLLLAYDRGQKKPKEVHKIIKKESWLDPQHFIAYQLKNGKAYKIMNDKIGQIKENMIDDITDAFSDEFNKILEV